MCAPYQKQRAYFNLQFVVCQVGTQVRNMDVGVDTQAMAGAIYWLAPHDLFSLLSFFSFKTQYILLRVPRNGI